jgi:hypothetical protein
MFLLRYADEHRVEIYPIHDEAMGSEKPRVLTGATGHVQDILAVRVELP